MPRLLSHPTYLRQARQQLARKEKTRDIDRIVALAECNFRLAVHPETPFTEAVSLLRESIRFDGVNPRYAFHLGRLHYVHGDFQRAADWLRIACCLSPTSHRIWVHVGNLLRELNSFYHGKEDFEPNVLMQRSEAIAKAIREGEDHINPDLLDFVPPRSLAAKERDARQQREHSDSSNGKETADRRPSAAVKRYVGANRCRWSGIDHLLVEQLLEARASEASIRKIRPHLERIAGAIDSRPGLPAAFAILCVQWLICGYPPATIRDLSAKAVWPRWAPSRHLLDAACEAFECDPADVVSRLAEHVTQGTMPPLFAALIHQRRLLRDPLEFRSVGAYRAAKKIVSARRLAEAAPGAGPAAEPDAEMVQDCIRRLQRATNDLRTPPPPVLRDDTPAAAAPAPLSSDSALAQFTALEEAARTLDALREEAFHWLKSRLEPASSDLSDPGVCAQTIADRAALEELVAAVSEAGVKGLQRLDALGIRIAVLPADAMGSDFETRSEACRKAFQNSTNPGNFTKVLKRIDKRLGAAAQPAGRVEPALELSVLLASVRNALPSEEAVPSPAGGSVSNASADDSISRWTADAQQTRAELEQMWPALKDLVAEAKERALSEDEEGACARIRARFEELMTAGDAILKDVQSCRQSGAIPPEKLSELDAVEKLTQDNLLARGRFQKNFNKLPAPREAPLEAVPAAATANEGSAEPPPGTAVPATAQPVPPAGVEGALARTDGEITRLFEEARATFDRYPEWVRRLPPFQWLRVSVRARQAETYYRLGRRREARRIWGELLREDRLDLRLLKNLAVCDTLEGDLGRSLTSWKSYLEMLYLHDVAGGDPRPNAAARAEFHRAFGNGYAPPFLAAPLNRDWADRVDSAALIAFLSSPGRVRNFVNHRLLEYLNTRFEFSSPSIVLGIKRIEAERLRETARDILLSFAGDAAQNLPPRVAEPFRVLTEKHLRSACDACASSQRLTLEQDPRYPEQEKKQLEILQKLSDLKYKLVIAFQSNRDILKNITSFEFLNQLERLDRIPLELSPELFRIVAGTMGMNEDRLREMPKELRETCVAGIMRHLFAMDADPAEIPLRERQYGLLIGTCLGEPSFKELLPVVDDASTFYPPEVAQALNGRDPSEPVLANLRKWHQSYPGLCGPALHLAILLIEAKAFEEAESVLERSSAAGIHPPTVRQARGFLMQLRAKRVQELCEQQHYAEALTLALQLVDLDDCQPVLVNNCLNLYFEAAQHLKKDPGRSRLDASLDAWFRRAEIRRAAPAEEGDDAPRATDLQMQELREYREKAMAAVRGVLSR